MKRLLLCSLLLFDILGFSAAFAAPLNLSPTPLFLTDSVAPMTMLVVSRDHRLYFEAYNDTTDVDGDGVVDIRFKPSIDYYGYFDSYKCYNYDSSNKTFNPSSVSASKKCSGNWSGNFLNYLTTSRIDALRKVLYGGLRSTDSASRTVLERSYIPQDGHSWGKEYRSTAVDGYNISDYTPYGQPNNGRYHLFANTTLQSDNDPLLRVALNQTYRIWEWVSIERPVAGSRALNGGSGPNISGISNFEVRVAVCDSAVGIEDNCRAYTPGFYKPTGLLQDFGENNSMLFGLITGSYNNNLQGGVLRKNISSIQDEINPNTGQFTSVNGIISSLNKLTFTGLQSDYTHDCGFLSTRNINNGECKMWGNPLAEMMYEAVRYFAGKASPTSVFNTSGGTDSSLGLPRPSWQNPYASNPRCAKANMLVISDVYPTYDSDQVPGSYFNSFSGDLSPSIDAASLGQKIYTAEGFASIVAFIGQSAAQNNGAPTAKTVTSFGNIRGLAPPDANSQGSYYPASVAYYGLINDLNAAKDTQNLKSYVVALSSPSPEISFKVGGRTITLIPFAKSVSGAGISPSTSSYQPTNSIVDFYIESLTNTTAVIRVNFDDQQQGGDFDMDAIVKYTITVNANNTLTVQSETIYSAGGITQHMGYTISGTTKDGVYLEVRDLDTAANQDVDYFLDTPPGADPGTGFADNTALPTNTTRIFTPSNQPSAIILNSPLWYAAKWGGFNDLNNSKTPDQTDEWDSAGTGDPDNFFLVTNALNLKTQLTAAFQQIIDRTGSFASVALNSGFLSSGTKIYQAIFKTIDWSGQLLAFAIDVNTGDVLMNGSSLNGAEWEASAQLALQNFNTGRAIISYNPVTARGIAFRWPANPASPTNSELSASQVAALNTNPVSGANDNLGNKRLNYIRGNKADEVKKGGSFRNRSSLLGDIINSSPVEEAAPEQQYPIVWPGSAPENAVPYEAFKAANINRQSIIYVGANDGMLHAFSASNGQELFAYIPSVVFSNLPQLTNPSYSHRYFVDGSPTIIDAFINSQWRTILAGGLNAGGQAIYALDITNPGQFNEASAANLVKWEFTDANDADLGYTFSQPAIVRLANGEWAAIFGNGYNNTFNDGNASTTGNAVLYIVNIHTGALIKKFDTKVGMSSDPLNTGRPNGLSTPAVVDMDGNGIADVVYAGDLFGNLWKINISGSDKALWDFSFKSGSNPQPLFVAQNSAGIRQAITNKPTVSRLKNNPGGVQVYIGTGKYLELGDKTDMAVQSVYGLRDDFTTVITGRSQLLQQSIISEQGNIRLVSTNLMANNQRGWYLDLIVNNNPQGERVISNLVFLNQKIIFSTIIPTSDPCDYGGVSWLMELDAMTGSRLNYNVFDVNGDSAFDDLDKATLTVNGVSTQVPVSGMKSEVGLISTPAILNAGKSEYKYMTGTGGGINKINENGQAELYGRQSWQQLQ